VGEGEAFVVLQGPAEAFLGAGIGRENKIDAVAVRRCSLGQGGG
jgi:hypothetical protein